MMDLPTLCADIERGSAPTFLFFWGHGVQTPPGPTCLSQWYPTPFEVDGERFETAEHWMMAGKARLFGDEAARQKVLAAGTPKEAKRIGRTVRGFDENAWRSNRLDIVVRGNIAKFEQNDDLRSYLCGTGAAVLVEASPFDRIWGIGLAASHEAAANPRRWRGQNLLGFALMAVRSALCPTPSVSPAP